MWSVYTVNIFEYEEAKFRVMHFSCWLRNIELYDVQVIKVWLLNIWAKSIYTATSRLMHVYEHFSKPVIIIIDINIRTNGVPPNSWI